MCAASSSCTLSLWKVTQKAVLHFAQEMSESVMKHCEQFINITSSSSCLNAGYYETITLFSTENTEPVAFVQPVTSR